MTFNPNQSPHRALRSIVAERTQKLVIWVGSGLSADANLPTWLQLKNRLIQRLREKARDISADDANALVAAADKAHAQPNCWLSFEILRRHLGGTSYRSTIREALRTAPTTPCPPAYSYLWRLGASGILNLNLDRLATRALGEVTPRRLATEFSGCDAAKFVHALGNPHPFVANLHGIVDDESTWIFTKSDLSALLNSHGYREFINGCLGSTTTLFIGITADDIAAGGHLASLTKKGIDVGDHYWLTSRDDLHTDTWAEEAGIQIIRYGDTSGHPEVTEFFEDILRFVPEDDKPSPPVVLSGLPTTSDTLLTPEQLSKLEAEDIRRVLNAHAKQLMSSPTNHSYEQYEAFATRYDEAIYRAWYTSANPPSNHLLGFTLSKEVGRGAFGCVYRAEGADGHPVAIKVLHQEVRRNPEFLGSFRRGVRSMRLLASRNVAGMVAYRDASEIPAFVVMDWVDGPTLAEAHAAHQLKDWASILRIALEMTDVIRRAHAIPERVLHRDVRPSNIMLDCFYTQPDAWQVVVLDFDLSWHLGALEKSVIQNTPTGYLAPEQIQKTHGASTRNAAVDSFGVGMTLYFMLTGRDPIPAQHRHPDWETTILTPAKALDGDTWQSLPFRYTRLVMKATAEHQAMRWDISQIRDELQRLNSAFLEPSTVVSAELLAEEVAARSKRRYVWDDDQATATMYLPSGLAVSITGNESDRLLRINLNWHSSGSHDRKQVGKWMGPATERSSSILRKGGWRITVQNIRPPESVAIEARLSVASAAASLAKQGGIVADVATALSFD